MNTTEKKALVQGVSKKVCRLETFTQELRNHKGLTIGPEDMRFVNDGHESHGGQAWGRGGSNGGWGCFGESASLPHLEEIIIHEYCHVVLWRIIKDGVTPRYFVKRAFATEKHPSYHFDNKGEMARYYLRKAFGGHGPAFCGLLMSATSEYFDIPWEDQAKLFKVWSAMKERAKRYVSPISAYMLDDVICDYVEIRDGIKHEPSSRVGRALEEVDVNPYLID
mgnify:FL=1